MRCVWLVVASLLIACGEASPQTPLPAEVDAVIALRCRQCHGRPRHNFAPISIVTWQDTQAVIENNDGTSETVYEAIGRRIHDPRFPMPPFMQPELLPDERAILDAWVQAGGPPAEADDAHDAGMP